MKSIKSKYVLGLASMLTCFVLSVVNIEIYGALIPALFIIMSMISAYLLLTDRHKKTYVVRDANGKIIRSFGKEEDAIKFADNQNKETNIVMVMI
jgi:hypothetical protein